MIPTAGKVATGAAGVLHVCGDDPIIHGIARSVDECSPRMWR